MATQIVCPRCGARDSFMKGYLPETCVCRVCQSQLDWHEIRGCGPDCKALMPESPPPPPAPSYVIGRTEAVDTAAQDTGGEEAGKGEDDGDPAADSPTTQERGEGDR